MLQSNYTSSELRYSVYFLERISAQLQNLEKLYLRYCSYKATFDSVKRNNTIQLKKSSLIQSSEKSEHKDNEVLFNQGVESIYRLESYFDLNNSIIKFKQGECALQFHYENINILHETSKHITDITKDIYQSLSLAESVFINNEHF